MKSLIALCSLSLVLTFPWHRASASPQEQKQAVARDGTNGPQNSREWRAATYLGLTMGKSHRTDVVRILGEPQSVDRPSDQNLAEEDFEIWYVYEAGRDFPGRLTVVMHERTDVVLRIDIAPDNLFQADAVKRLGSDFILTRYAFDDCLGKEESSPLYESANGPLINVEYRHRGIALSVTEAGKVNTISYVSKPLGTLTSRCKNLKYAKT